ncbi:discoidin domain-containing protein [[Ruminococcus] torques]|uniref:discoidin domain-containing protein n=1 Tax=[Ruminococcus] torques TaxID=33039 RepID=UPI0025A3C886|nr:discoidin domain-containing protein [[Ruminococcus] torques]MDM8236102.1 glycoside hydrolase family 31 protein [[Ruminococcus] torques]
MKKIRKAGAWLLAGAMTVSTFAYAVPSTVQAADGFTGVLNKVDSVDADGNVVEISFNDGAVKGRITFLENGVFRYNVDPSGEFSEYAKVRGGYPDTGKIQAQPDDSDRYTKPAADVSDDADKFTITNDAGDTVIEFDKETAIMTVKAGDTVVMEEAAPLNIGSSSTTQTLVKHDETNYNASLREEFYGGGTQNGRFVHTDETINISNESSWTDGGVSSPSPFYYTSNGYGVLRNTWQDGKYDFGETTDGVVTATHNENEYDAYIFVSGSDNGSDVSVDLLDEYYTVTGNPALLPSYAFYLGHLNAYNRDAWSATQDIGSNWTIKGNEPYTSAGTTTYEAGGTGFQISANQQAETLNGYGPTVSTDLVPDGVTYSEEFSARAVLDEYLDYDMPFGYFLPNDGYGAGYGQNGYNMTGGVNADGTSSPERLAAVAANVQNLKEFADYAADKGVATGLWTQSNLTPDSNANTYWHTLRDFNAEVNAGVTTLKTDVAWVGYGYSFQLSGVKQAYDIITENQSTRPNIISLDGWAGSQRYNGVWTGDQTGGNWEYIRFHIPTFIGQSLSGNPNIGSDMDGIWGGSPLIATRDYQWKSFAPLMLDMDGWGSYAKGPYVHGDPYTGISRMYLKMKAMMMPYTYTNAYAAANLETGNDDKGLPMIRAMFLEYPDEAYAYTEAGSQYQYMWGENLLVAPVYQDTQADEMGNDVRDGIYLPGGDDQIWIDYFTGEQYRGGQILNGFDAPLWKIPLFVKNGAIIPMYAEHNVAVEGVENGVDKTQRIVEFWPEGETDFSAIEDDGASMTNDIQSVEGYGDLDNIDYGDHVTTKYTSKVDGDTATLTAEKSTGSYAGYDQNKDTTFVVNVSKEPTAVTAYNGSEELGTKVEAEDKADFDSKIPEAGEFIYFYDETPEIETFASEEETIIAGMVENVEVSPKLYVKFAATDTQANEQKLVIEGFENTGDLNGTGLNENLDVPVLSEDVEAKTPTSITLTWEAVADATGYEILVDGTIDEDGNVTSGMINSVAGGADATSFTHTGLQYKTEHSYYIRSVNKEGHSAWSEEFVTESADDPFRLSPDVTEDQITWEGAIYGSHNPILAFDETFQSGDAGFHSNGNSIGQTLTVDYGNAYVFDYIEYYPRDDAGNGTLTSVLVETSLDGVNWVKHGDAGSSTDADADLSFDRALSADMWTWDLTDPNTGADSIGARYIRITPLASMGNFFSASEIKVYTIDGGYGSAQSPFRVGNITSVGTSEPTLLTFQQMYQKESSAHGSYKDNDWVGEIQNQYGDINFNGISDIWDYAFTAFAVDGGTTQTGSVSGDILLQPSATTVDSGEEFTVSVTALDVENLNAYGTIIDYDPDQVEYVGTAYTGTGSMYTQGMTGNIVNDDGTAYVNHNAVNMGDQPLVNGSKVLATITMRAKADIDLSDTDVIDLSTVTLMGPDFSVKESKVVSEVEIPDVPTETTVEYGQNAFDITMTNDVLTTDDGSNVTQIVQTGNYNGLFDGAYGRDFEFVWDMGETILADGQKLPTTMHFAFKTPSKLSSVEVYNANRGNGYLLSMSAEVFYEDGTSDVQNFDTEAEVYTIKADSSKNVIRVDVTCKTSNGLVNEGNDPRENRMLTLAEIDFYYTAGQKAESIAPAEGTATEMYVGYVENINAVVYPEGFPNQYFTVTSSNPEVASIITLVDANGAPSYKVLALKEGTTKITLTSAADESVTDTYTLTVTDGVDKSALVDAISATTGVTESIYTADSYAAYKTAYDNAVTVNEKADATRAEVEAAVEQLLTAYDALVIQPVDESIILKDSIVTGGDALYSESNTYDRMFDNDLSTYWESPYIGENAKLPQDVVLELADTYQLEQVSFTSHTIQNGGVTEYTVSVSTDGEEWTEVASGTVDANAYKQGQNVRVDARFAPADAKYVKFTVEGAVGREASEDNMYGRIAEMDLYGTTKADKTKLSALIAEVNALDPNDYTEESWAVLSEALEAANAVAADNSATAAQVKDAYDALMAAKGALEETTDPGPTPEDPRVELATLIGKMSGVVNDNYTKESWDAFQARLKAAIELDANAATDEEVQAMIDALNAAYEGLVKDGKAELESVIDQMENVEKGNYTDTSWNAFQAKLAEAKAMLDAGTATDDEMLAMAQELQAAFDSLVKKDDGQPGKPGTGTGGSGADGDKAVQTGDAASPAGLLAVLAISGGAVVVLARRKKVR